MDRQQILDSLSSLGFDVSLVDDSTPDNVLAETLRVLQSVASDNNADNGNPPDGNVPSKNADNMNGSNDDPTVSATMCDANNPADGKMAEGAPPASSPPAAVVPVAAAPAPKQTTVTHKYSEKQNSGIRLTQAQLEEIIDKRVAAREAQIKQREGVNVFCERMRKEGKLLPAHLDGDGKSPTIKDALESLAENKDVTKFSEGTKKLSVLDAMMRAIENGPSLVKFSETMRDREAAVGKMDESKKTKMLAMTPAGREVLKRQAAK